MPELRILNADDTRQVLTMDRCIEALQDAMIAVSDQRISMPPRIVAPLADGSGFMADMPGSALEPPVFGTKVVSLLPVNPSKGRPAIQGFVALFDHETGTPIALVEGAEVTSIRTAGASGLATKLLAREDARTHGILGTGVLARTHTLAILATRPDLEETQIWGRDLQKAEALAAGLVRETGHKVRATASVEEAAACDIVSTVTGATSPILAGAWVQPGAHVNLVGAHKADEREADSALITRGAIYVDSLESAMREAGEILIPMDEGVFKKDDIIGEVGALAAGSIKGRQGREDITVYKSLGVVAQDLFAAWAAFECAERDGIGTVVTF